MRKHRRKREVHFKKIFISDGDIWRRWQAIREQNLREEVEPLTYEKVKKIYGFKKAGMLFVYKLENYIGLSRKDRKNLPEEELVMINKYTDLFKKSSIKHTFLLNILQIYKNKVIRVEYSPKTDMLGSDCGEIINLQKTMLLERTFQIFKKLKNFDKNIFNKIVSDMIKMENAKLSDLLLNDYLLLGSLLKNPTLLKTKSETENIILQQKANQR